MKVNNVPDWAKKKPFMVVRMVDGVAWFYGGWDDGDKAMKQAAEVGGMVIPTSAVIYVMPTIEAIYE